MIFVDFCLFGEYKCFLDYWFIIVLLESFVFGDLLEFIDEDENVDDLLKGLNYYIWEKNCVRIIELFCNFLVFLKVLDIRWVINCIVIIKCKDIVIDVYRLFGFIFLNLIGEYCFVVVFNGFVEVWFGWIKNWRIVKKVVFM